MYPTQFKPKDARLSLRKAEVTKSDEQEDNQYEQELKQKTGSLKRVPVEDNPVLKDMDERTDVKVCIDFLYFNWDNS